MGMKVKERHHHANGMCGMQNDESVDRGLHRVHNTAHVCIKNLSIVATSVMVQKTENALDAVVTAEGKGTFLIRRWKNQPVSDCVFLSCEVRRMNAACQQTQSA